MVNLTNEFDNCRCANAVAVDICCWVICDCDFDCDNIGKFWWTPDDRDNCDINGLTITIRCGGINDGVNLVFNWFDTCTVWKY